jgi:lambda family phage portal protein
VNALDRIIGWVSPALGLQRARARAALSAVNGYEAAKAGRRGNRQARTQSSANAVIGRDGLALRARSRYLARNNPYAARAIDILVANIIGEGIMAQPATGDEAADKRVLDLWRRWVDQADAVGQLDFYGLQAQAVRTWVESGEVLARRRVRRASDGLIVPLQIQVIEPDYLDPSRDTIRPSVGDNVVVQGIELDIRGRRVAYWLYREHPGDITAALRSDSLSAVRVTADQVAHLYRIQRPGQLRGVPWLAPAIVRLDDLDEYHEAALVKAKIEACFGAFVTQQAGVDGTPLGNEVDASTGERIESFEPGMIGYLQPGESVEFANPTGSSAFEPFTLHTLQAIAVATGVTYDQLTGDLRQANYSSLRAGKIEFRRLVRQMQWHAVVPMLCQPVWDWFVASATLSGALPDRPGGYPVRWVPPAHEPIDPYKDVQAEIEAIRSGLSTWKQAVGRQGYDPDEQLREIQATNEALDAAGIVVTADPRRVTATGAAVATMDGQGRAAPAEAPQPAPAIDREKVLRLARSKVSA